jgi:D-threo-aldose 1-dehydrogenase
LSTKAGRLLEPVSGPQGVDTEGFDVPATHRRVWDFSRDGVLRSLEESLERLKLDRVDIIYLHDPDNHYRDALSHAYPALEKLRGQGVVSAIGAGMNQAAMLADFARNTDMDLLMLAGLYTLLEPLHLARADSVVRVSDNHQRPVRPAIPPTNRQQMIKKA